MLAKTLLVFTIVCNFATLVGLWIGYEAAPATLQARIGHVLLLCGAIASIAAYVGFAIFVMKPDHRSRVSAGSNQTPKEPEGVSGDDAFKNPTFTIVNGVRFHNETVLIDGKRFINCAFDDVTLSFNGSAPFEIIGGKSNGHVGAETTHPIARTYAHVMEIVNSLAGNTKVKFSTRGADDSSRPSLLRVTELSHAQSDMLSTHSRALLQLPVYRQELEVELLALCTGTRIHGPATVFLLLKTRAKKDLNLIGLTVTIFTTDDKHSGTVIKNLSEWMLSEEFLDPQYKMKNRRKTNLESNELSLIKEIENGIFCQGYHPAKWVGCEIPTQSFLSEADIKAVTVEFRDDAGIARAETFRKWPNSTCRVEDAAFTRL
jgi:hypothetical protein